MSATKRFLPPRDRAISAIRDAISSYWSANPGDDSERVNGYDFRAGEAAAVLALLESDPDVQAIAINAGCEPRYLLGGRIHATKQGKATAPCTRRLSVLRLRLSRWVREPKMPPNDPGVTQTILWSPENEAAGIPGNCLQAAVATLLDLPLDAVPHFSTFQWWPQALTLWAYGRDLQVCGERVDAIPERRCIVGGKSPRGVSHVVIGEHGEVVWDPHPDRSGLTTVRDCTWFEPKEPGAPCPHLWGPVVAAHSLTDEQLRDELDRRAVSGDEGDANATAE